MNVKVGDKVRYTDESSVQHQALVTCVHTQECINLVYVSGDPNKEDQYGRQLERANSVQMKSDMTAHGRFFE